MRHRDQRLRSARLVRQVREAERASSRRDHARARRLVEAVEQELSGEPRGSAYLAALKLDLAEHALDARAMRRSANALVEREPLFPAVHDILERVDDFLGRLRVQPLARSVPDHRRLGERL